MPGIGPSKIPQLKAVVLPLFELGCVVVLSLSLAPAAAAAARPPVPVLAYYYIWYTPHSWERGKTDAPLLGPYSSNDERVMRRHIRWARAAGIDGFIVSWKRTAALDRRLEKLVRVADATNFKLAIIYQGLDFTRRPLASRRVGADLRFFAAHFGSAKAFRIYPKPLVIWSGTWKVPRNQIEGVVASVRNRLLVLASEKNARGYERLADVVDGDAYYWSSVDPQTYPHYPDKLIRMGQIVHSHGGLWIAPAAPGFDARAVGGHIVVSRRGGSTLTDELNGAMKSDPDAVGLISWNEFSENSEVEPSQKYGPESLGVLADALGGGLPADADFSSDSPTGRSRTLNVLVLSAASAALIGLVMWVFIRSMRAERTRTRAHENDSRLHG